MGPSSPHPRLCTLPATHTRVSGHAGHLGSPVPLHWVSLPWAPPVMSPHSQSLKLTGANDLLNVDSRGLDLAGETAAHPARLLVGVGFCIELGLWDLPRRVVQGQEDGWRR